METFLKLKMKKWTLKIVVLMIPLFFLFVILDAAFMTIVGSASHSEDDSALGNANVSAEVMAYKPTVEKYASKYGMSQYVNLILAVMQQESDGQGKDVMQCSEGEFNTIYPHSSNGITDSDYSIDCGIQELKDDFTKAGVKDANDMDNIKIGLQAYNMGVGFISFAKSHGGYSKENAIAFANMHGGVGHYGDVDYVPHVLQYYISSADIKANSAQMQSVINIAKQQLLKPYAWGASGPNSFDCSGLVYFCYKSAGINVTRDTAEGYFNECTKVSNPQVGDLVFFGTPVEHVGICIGNGQMIDAPHTGAVVRIEKIWTTNFVGYGHLGK